MTMAPKSHCPELWTHNGWFCAWYAQFNGRFCAWYAQYNISIYLYIFYVWRWACSLYIYIYMFVPSTIMFPWFAYVLLCFPHVCFPPACLVVCHHFFDHVHALSIHAPSLATLSNFSSSEHLLSRLRVLQYTHFYIGSVGNTYCVCLGKLRSKFGFWGI